MNFRKFWLNLVISLLISSLFIFSGTDSITDIIDSQYFLSDLGISFLLIFAVLTYIAAVIQYLDRKYNWQEHFTVRISYHLLAGVILPAIVVFAVMYIYFFVFYKFEQEEVHFFYTEFPFSVIIIIAVNIAYSAHSFFQDNRKHHNDLLSLKQQLYTLQNLSGEVTETTGLLEDNGRRGSPVGTTGKMRTFIAVSGNKNIPIPVDEICCFCKDGSYTELKTFASKTYLLNHTLEDLIKNLDSLQFFRANRQYIINRKACDYFTNEDNGKLELFLKPSHDEEIIISQKRAPVFREWINK
ncbi:MAG TPA: LytTR family DNA-binding domain-containing protein [Daejeonella sp.]|nr:LytTR family DNA-binding domain-containing protein [Daejeonella sp.]